MEPGSAALTLELVHEFDEKAQGSRYTEAYKQNKTADVTVRRLLGFAISQRASDIHLEMLSEPPADPLSHRRRAATSSTSATLQDAATRARARSCRG